MTDTKWDDLDGGEPVERKLTDKAIPRAEDEPTVPLWPTAGKALGMGRCATYSGAERGTLPFPIIRSGRKIRVPTAALRRLLELDSPYSGASKGAA